MMSIYLFAGMWSSNFQFVVVELLHYTYVCICRFYLCMWYKDDAQSPQKLMYHLARLNSKAIVRDSSSVTSCLTRDSVKKISLALGQINSFSRGFDKILHTLLVTALNFLE